MSENTKDNVDPIAVEKQPRFDENQLKSLKEYRHSNQYKIIQNQAKLDIEKRKMVERFQQYSKLEAQKHLKQYVDGKFWKTMSNSML